MKQILFSLIVFALILTPSVANSQGVLPFIDLKTTECVFETGFQVYGTRFDMLSLSQNTQTVVIYTAWPEGYEKSYQMDFGMGQRRYVEFFNFNEPPLYYLFQTYDSEGVLTGEKEVRPKFCKRSMFIPSVRRGDDRL
jgi:hypothetical protein